ncbi:hypothetical protein GQX74_006883 [Glossina fuscipes]|nr:hypothetical protein GQX74_006883 [Glossina fuscipes]
MAHIRLNLTIRVLPLKLLLILGIIYGILAKPTVVTLLKTDISSPVPFITQTLPDISTRKIDENTLPMLATTIATNLRENDYVDNIGITDGKHKDKDKDKDVEFNDFIISERPDTNIHNDAAKGNNNNDNDYVETVVKYVDITTPTSMEQQDGPIVPPTTITFSNIASASVWGESSGGGLAFDAGVIFNGATPPYAAVDDNYGFMSCCGNASNNSRPLHTGNDILINVKHELQESVAVLTTTKYWLIEFKKSPTGSRDKRCSNPEEGGDHIMPSKPLNLTVLDVTSSSITMSWLPPKNQNGAIAGYHVFHIHENQTGVEIVKRNAADSVIRFELPKLKPFTEYRVIVKAFTTKNEGDSSDQIIQRTDVAGPSAPIVVNLTCHSQDSLTIRWKRPLEYYNNIDFYVIKTKIIGQDTHRDIRINASEKELETAVRINLN